jgi:hypothetical protein
MAFAMAMAGFLLSGVSAPIHAQPIPWIPEIDHYKIYDMNTVNVVSDVPVSLYDQFVPNWMDVTVDGPWKLGTPTNKNDEGYFDWETHYTWYRVNNAPDLPWKSVAYYNQFGPGWLSANDPQWLLVPALKNPLPGSPEDGFPLSVVAVYPDHYLCYDALGESAHKTATLETQFGFENVAVTYPELFCNPVNKQHDGQDFLINNNIDHLVCYKIDPPHTVTSAGFALEDQITRTEAHTFESQWLCVPSFKEDFVQTKESTWGKLKSIYR